MSKILSRIFPLADHLYIYQVFEYNSWDFLKWFFNNINKRNLQKKHKLHLTNKAFALLVLSLTLILLSSWYITMNTIPTQGFFWIVFLFLMGFSPIFLVISSFIYKPLEIYLKNEIIQKAKEKLEGLPNLKVIAITGSFGKTSTKDILYTLLFKKYYVVKTPKSFNTPLGIAQTILEDVKTNTQIFIAEIGAYKMGEIRQIASAIKPKIGIITAVAPQHLERFGSLENIALAKFELPQSLGKTGIAILNKNFEQIKKFSPTLSSKVIFYGTSDSPFYTSNINVNTHSTTFILNTPKGKAEIILPLIGQHHVQNFLAASVAAMQLGLTLSEVQKRASLVLPTPHRLEIKKTGGVTIIDNTFNTNPKSAQSSLELLKNYPATQRIIVTPGLVELGKESAKENREFSKIAGKIVDIFIIVGEYAKKDLLRGLSNFPKEKICLVPSTQDGIKLLTTLTKPGAVVLLENDLPDQYL